LGHDEDDDEEEEDGDVWGKEEETIPLSDVASRRDKRVGRRARRGSAANTRWRRRREEMVSTNVE